MSEARVLQKYSTLVQAFIDGDKTAEEFSSEFMDEFTDEEDEFSEETYQILQHLFAESDAFCPDPDLRDERDIDAAELRNVASAAAEKLEQRTKELDCS